MIVQEHLLRVTVEHDKGLNYVRLVGEMDLSSAEYFERSVEDIHGPLVVDCDALTFIDSSGAAAVRRAFKRNPSLTLRHLRPNCRLVFDLLEQRDMVALEER